MANLRDVVFRCDASPEIGAGHVTRCSALAGALRECGIESTFVLSAGSVNGFRCVTLPQRPGPLGEEDMRATAQIASELGATAVVVDHYGVAPPYLSYLSSNGLHVGVIDDRGDRDLRAASWLLNQNISAQALDYRVGPDCDLALGLEFAMIRPAFEAARKRAGARTFAPESRNVLITMGGGDVRATSSAAVGSFDSVDSALALRVIGDADVRSSRHTVERPGAVRDMEEHMLWADVAVTAAGSTCWELMCLGVPMVVVALDEGQQRNALAIRDAGAGIAVESLDDVGAAAAHLLDAPDRRAEISRRARELVDGRGAERAASSLVASALGAAHAVG